MSQKIKEIDQKFNKQHPVFPWVLKQIKTFEFEQKGNLKDKVIVITGASRGIGLAIANRAAKDGAIICILAKTDVPNPKLPGTIYTAAAEIEKNGGKALPLKVDIRYESQIKDAVDKIIEKFGRIDILINNASALNLAQTDEITAKQFDLMHQINTRGTFVMCKHCIPHMLESENPHILNIAPPLSFNPQFVIFIQQYGPHVAYTIAKMGMSLCVQGLSKEFEDECVGVNALWPRTSIATAAVNNVLGEQLMKTSRKPEIMADAAYIILTSNSSMTNGNYFIDDEVLASQGIVELSKYQVQQDLHFKQLTPDFFL